MQIGPWPLVLPYIVLLTLFALAFAGALFMPEPVQQRGRFRLTVERPSIPPPARRPFVLAGLAVLSSWSIGGLFFSLGPQLGAHLFDSTNAIASAIGIAALAGSAAISQLVFGRLAPWIGASAGSVALAGGTLLIVVATGIDSSAAYLVGSIVAGIGFGIAFLGGLRTLVAAIPPDHRAAVMSAFYLVAYASISVPAVLAGLLVSHLGLTETFESFGCVVAALALVVALEAWRTRPGRRPAQREEPAAAQV